MGAIIMNGAQVGSDCIIGAGSLVTQGTVIPDGMLAFGSPAKVIRPLTDAEKKENQTNGHQLHADEKCTKRVKKLEI